MLRVGFSIDRLLVAVTLLIALSIPAVARAQVTNRIFVPSSGDIVLSIVDRASGGLTAAPIVGPGTSDAAVSPDGRRAYVTSEFLGTVTVIDVPTQNIVGLPITVGSQPVGIALTPDGRKAYVATTAGVSVIDLTTNTVTTTIDDLGINPLAVAITPDGTRAYVSNETSNDVSVIDVATDAVIGSPIAVGATPLGLAITPDGSRVYVANQSDDTVSVIAIGTGAVIDVIGVSALPAGIAISPDGTTAYVTAGPAGEILPIDITTEIAGTAIAMTSGCGCPAGPSGVAFTPDGQRAYVPSVTSDELLTIDVAASTQINTPIPVGTAPQAYGMFISPNLIVSAGAGLTTASDADLTTRGFGPYLVFDGGILQTTANWTTSRAISMLSTGGTIDTNGFTATIGGDVINDGLLTKTGNGRLVLNGAETHLAGTMIGAGTLEVNGVHSSLVTILGGTLAGIGNLSMIGSIAGTISPGSNGPGMLHAGSVNMSAYTTFAVDLNGLAAGTGYDRLEAGSAAIGGATLTVHAGFLAPPGTSFTILTNATGTFARLPEGAVVVDHGPFGQRFRISYQGGSGSDVVLLTDLPPTISGPGDQTISANKTLGPLTFTLGDDQLSPSALIVSATSSNPALLLNTQIALTGTGSTRTLTATPLTDASGTTTIMVTVSDGASTASASFTLTVAPLPVYHLAEGATSAFFDTDVLLANPNSVPAPVTITFSRDDATTLIQHRTLPATSRTTIKVKEIDGLESANFSTSVTSNDGLPLVVERTMWWDASHYGAHGEKASAGPAPQWYFAEGSQGFFHTFFLLLNPAPVPNTAHVTYFLDGGAPVQRDYALPATSRVTIDVGSEPAVANRSFGALVTFDQPGMAERAMYFGDSPLFSGGHDSAGVTATANSWLLAEGATGSYFDTFVLVANPGDADANVTMTYLPAAGSPIVKTHAVAAHQRLTVNIAEEDPALASAAVGAHIAADQPIVVERSVYWPHGNWYEAHNSAAETSPATRWGLAEGRVGGPNHAQTYILLANPGTQPAAITATFLRTNGTTIVKTFTVAAGSRLNIAVTGPGSDVPELADEEFGTTIDSTQPIIVERSLYTDANGVTWAAGTNATGTRLP